MCFRAHGKFKPLWKKFQIHIFCSEKKSVDIFAKAWNNMIWKSQDLKTGEGGGGGGGTGWEVNKEKPPCLVGLYLGFNCKCSFNCILLGKKSPDAENPVEVKKTPEETGGGAGEENSEEPPQIDTIGDLIGHFIENTGEFRDAIFTLVLETKSSSVQTASLLYKIITII